MLETPHLYKQNYVITAVVPCYRERNQILSVLSKFDDTVNHIIVVDDACPEGTGEHVTQQCNDKRVQVIVNKENQHKILFLQDNLQKPKSPIVHKL